MALPQPLIALADDILHGRELSTGKQRLQAFLQETLVWLEAESDFWLSAEDADDLARVRALVDELERCMESKVLRGEDWSRRLIEVGALLVSYRERVRAAREQTYFFKIPVLDQLVVVCIAFLSDRARPGAIARRFERAEAAALDLRAELDRLGPALGEQTARLEQGLTELENGLQRLAAWLRDGSGRLQEATRQLLEGGRLVQSLHQACCKRDSVSTGWPEWDALLCPAMRAAAVGSEQEWQAARSALIEHLEALGALWASERSRLLVPARHLGNLVASVEKALAQLQSACLAGDRKPVWRAIKALDDLRGRLDKKALKLNLAAAAILEAPVQALAGAVRGEVPKVMLLEVARAFADPGAPAGTSRLPVLVNSYLASGNSARLVEAIELLLEVVEEMSRPGYALNGLVCRCCGQSYSFGAEQNYCMQPGRGHMFLDVCA